MNKEILLASLKEIREQIPAELIAEAEKDKEQKVSRLNELIEEQEKNLYDIDNLEGKYSEEFPKEVTDLQELVQNAQSEAEIAYNVKQNLLLEQKYMEDENENVIKSQIRYYERLVEKAVDPIRKQEYQAKLDEFKKRLENNNKWIVECKENIEHADSVISNNIDIAEDNLPKYYEERDKHWDIIDEKNSAERKNITDSINSYKAKAGFLNAGVFSTIDDIIAAVENDSITEEEVNNRLHDIKDYLGNDTDVLYAEHYNHDRLADEQAIYEEQIEILNNKLADENNYIMSEEVYLDSRNSLSRSLEREHRLLREQNKRVSANKIDIAANNELIARNYKDREELIGNRNKAETGDNATLAVLTKAIEECEAAIQQARRDNDRLEQRNQVIERNINNRNIDIAKYSKDLDNLERYHGVPNEEEMENDRATLNGLTEDNKLVLKLTEASKIPLVGNIDRLLERLGSNREELTKENAPKPEVQNIEPVVQEEISEEVDEVLPELNVVPNLNMNNSDVSKDNEINEDSEEKLIDDYLDSVTNEEENNNVIAPAIVNNELPISDNNEINENDDIIAPIINDKDLLEPEKELVDDNNDIVAPIISDVDGDLSNENEADDISKDDSNDPVVAPVVLPGNNDELLGNKEEESEEKDGSLLTKIEQANKDLQKNIKKAILGATLWLTLVVMGTNIVQSSRLNNKLDALQSNLTTKIEQVEDNLHEDHEQLFEEHAELAEDHDEIKKAIEENCGCEEKKDCGCEEEKVKVTPKPTSNPTPTPCPCDPDPEPNQDPDPVVPTPEPCPDVPVEPIPDPDPIPEPLPEPTVNETINKEMVSPNVMLGTPVIDFRVPTAPKESAPVVETPVEAPIQESLPTDTSDVSNLSSNELNNLNNASSSFSWESLFNGELENNNGPRL